MNPLIAARVPRGDAALVAMRKGVQVSPWNWDRSLLCTNYGKFLMLHANSRKETKDLTRGH